MNALVIDSSTQAIYVACKKGTQLIKFCLDTGNRQSQSLLVLVDFITKQLDLNISELDYTAVAVGPGSFTGLRLGLSIVKAINFSYNVPCYGICTLDLYKYALEAFSPCIISTLDARKDRFYIKIFEGLVQSDVFDIEVSAIYGKIKDKHDILLCGANAFDLLQRIKDINPTFIAKTFCSKDTTQALFFIAENMIKEGISPLKDYVGAMYVRSANN